MRQRGDITDVAGEMGDFNGLKYAEHWSSTGEYLSLFTYISGRNALVVGGNVGVGKEEGAQVEVADPPESYNLTNKSVSRLSAGSSPEVNVFSLGRVAGSLEVNNEKSSSSRLGGTNDC